MKLLEYRTAVITGGTSGIGKAIAKLFADEGARVILVGMNPEKGAQAVEELRACGVTGEVFFHSVDVSDYAAVHELIDELLLKYNKIDVLVNSAGITRDKLLVKMTEEDWDSVMTTNVKSCYNTCHAVARAMIKVRAGKIINIGSVVGEIGNAGQVNYAASKAAIVGFTKALAKELASRNILVNVIAPGYIGTPMTEALSDDQKKATLSQIPLGRMGHPDEVAQLALFLASDKANYITGQALFVDGGMAI